MIAQQTATSIQHPLQDSILAENRTVYPVYRSGLTSRLIYRYSTSPSASGSHGLSSPLQELNAVSCASVESLMLLFTADSSVALSTAQQGDDNDTVEIELRHRSGQTRVAAACQVMMAQKHLKTMQSLRTEALATLRFCFLPCSRHLTLVTPADTTCL